MPSYFVYSITAGAHRYVGLTRDKEKRRRSHQNRLMTSNWPLYKALREAGVGRVELQVHHVTPEDEAWGSPSLRMLEQSWVDALGADLNVKSAIGTQRRCARPGRRINVGTTIAKSTCGSLNSGSRNDSANLG